MKLVAKMLKAIHAHESKEASRAKARDAIVALREMKLKEVAKKVEDSVDETLTYTAFPYKHWTRIGSKLYSEHCSIIHPCEICCDITHNQSPLLSSSCMDEKPAKRVYDMFY